ncbi:hypothetical protein K523DRAFT_334027 [Schizophyllum commune Tattone D]|nr:hypothetical protein K523DRAFT_334027 [Schizophyllum commune Tattone D]
MTADELTTMLDQLSLASPPPAPPVVKQELLTPPASPQPPTSKSRTSYVVFVGRRPGVYVSWEACQSQVTGASHNSHKSYTSFAAAQRAFSAAEDRGLVCTADQRASDVGRPFVRQRLWPEDLPLCTHFLDDPTSKAMAFGSTTKRCHECSYLTSGYPGSRHASFETREAAIASLEGALAEGKAIKFVTK